MENMENTRISVEFECKSCRVAGNISGSKVLVQIFKEANTILKLEKLLMEEHIRTHKQVSLLSFLANYKTYHPWISQGGASLAIS